MFHKILSFLRKVILSKPSRSIVDNGLTTKSFSNNPYFDTSLKIQALHELSHAVAMALHGIDGYRKITHKSINLNVGSFTKNPVFTYKHSEDPDSRELFIDMMICLAGFVGELEFLNVDSTNAGEDINDWHDSLRCWLLHYNNDYIAHTHSEAEITWNNKIIEKYKHRQTMMLRKLLRTNEEVIMKYLDILIEKHTLDNKEINELLDNIEIPVSVEMEFDKILEDARFSWH